MPSSSVSLSATAEAMAAVLSRRQILASVSSVKRFRVIKGKRVAGNAKDSKPPAGQIPQVNRGEYLKLFGIA
jgi:hypothetical protein